MVMSLAAYGSGQGCQPFLVEIERFTLDVPLDFPS